MTANTPSPLPPQFVSFRLSPLTPTRPEMSRATKEDASERETQQEREREKEKEEMEEKEREVDVLECKDHNGVDSEDGTQGKDTHMRQSPPDDENT